MSKSYIDYLLGENVSTLEGGEDAMHPKRAEPRAPRPDGTSNQSANIIPVLFIFPLPVEFKVKLFHPEPFQLA